MKFSCTQENLKRGLMTVGTVASKNVNLPILSNVLVKIEGNAIQLISTNLEVAVRCTVRGKVEHDGEFTFPCKLLVDYVNLLPDERVDLELSESVLKVACKKQATKIKGLPATEFPLIPVIERKHQFFVEADKLRRGLQQTSFAVSTSESRPELTGAYFNVNPTFAQGKIVIAATDSYRLSEKTLPLAQNGKAGQMQQVGVIVPGRTLNELSRIMALYKDEELGGPVEVSIGEGQVAFRFGEVEVISRVIESRYPEYRPIIPERFVTNATFLKSEMIQAVKGAALFSRVGLQDVRFRLVSGQGVNVASGDGQTGDSASAVEAEIDGPENAITLNYRYVLDGLSALGEGQVAMRMIDAMNPCLLAPAQDSQDENFVYIVMPIKQ